MCFYGFEIFAEILKDYVCADDVCLRLIYLLAIPNQGSS